MEHTDHCYAATCSYPFPPRAAGMRPRPNRSGQSRRPPTRQSCPPSSRRGSTQRMHHRSQRTVPQISIVQHNNHGQEKKRITCDDFSRRPATLQGSQHLLYDLAFHIYVSSHRTVTPMRPMVVCISSRSRSNARTSPSSPDHRPGGCQPHQRQRFQTHCSRAE